MNRSNVLTGTGPLVYIGFEISGGTKYDYKPRTVTFYFKPVK